jgi:hypothetical protein
MKQKDGDEGKKVRKVRARPAGSRDEKPTVADVLALAAVLRPRLLPRHPQRIAPGTRLALKLSRDERNLTLHTVACCGLGKEHVEVLEQSKEPELSMALADWDDFGGWVAGVGNHARSGSSLRSRADRFFDRIRQFVDSCAEE